MGTSMLIVVAVAALCELFLLIVFLYQRSVRELAFRLGMSTYLLTSLYPNYMLLMYRVLFLRWPCYIYLVFVKWWIAVCIFSAGFVLSLVLPVHKRNNLLKMRKILKKRYSTQMATAEVAAYITKRSQDSGEFFVHDNYEIILEAIDISLIEDGYDISNLAEYAQVSRLLSLGISDKATAIICTAGDAHVKIPKLFHNVPQAGIHIAVIKRILGIDSR